MVPIQVLGDIDAARNPMHLTKERLERAATENQFMNGKIAGIDVSSSWFLASPLSDTLKSYRSILNESLERHFPETAEHLPKT